MKVLWSYLLLGVLLSGSLPGQTAFVPTLKTFGTAGKELTPLSIDAEALEFSAYRFHGNDPVFYQNGLKLTLRCGDTVNGRAIGHPLATIYATCICLYQW